MRLTSIGPRTIRPPVPLVPGASLTALLSGGDLVLGAVGTVTYVDGSTVLGFGHPFTGAGPSRFLMGDGYVFQTIAAPITGSSYKLAEPGTLQGMIVGDRTDGVTGRLGPVEGIAGTATAENASRGTSSTVSTTIAPDDRTAPIIAALLQDEPAIRATDGLARGTMSLRVQIESPALKRPFIYRNLYAAEGDVVTLASGAAARVASIMLQNGVRRVPISAITIDERLETAVRAARIVRARIAPRRVAAGGRAVLFLRIQPWRAAQRTIRVPVRIPDTLFPGRAAIRVIPNVAGRLRLAPRRPHTAARPGRRAARAPRRGGRRRPLRGAPVGHAPAAGDPGAPPGDRRPQRRRPPGRAWTTTTATPRSAPRPWCRG